MKNILIAALLSAAGMATQAGAQPVQPAVPVGPPAQAIPVVPRGQGTMGGRMQADLTRPQAQQMADAMFQRFDSNHDGVLTRDEAQQALAMAQAARGGGDDGEQGGGRAQRMLDRMFGDAPSVTLQQFEAQALARFDRQDLNHDGVVTQAERQRGWANRAQ